MTAAEDTEDDATSNVVEFDGAVTVAATSDPDNAIDGAAFVLDQPEGMAAIWGRSTQVLWPTGEALMIAGGQGLGKTTLAGMLLKGLLGLQIDSFAYLFTTSAVTSFISRWTDLPRSPACSDASSGPNTATY